MNLRENWRLVLLVAIVLLSAVALFVPGATLASGGGNNSSAGTGVTNLQYGLQLSGGTQIRAPLVGLTAENVNVQPENQSAVAANVTDALGVDPTSVRVRTGNDSATVEVFEENVTRDEFQNALAESGLDVQGSDIRSGVTAQTRSNAVDVIERKVSGSGFSGGSVQQVTSGNNHYIQVEVPNQNRSEIRDLVEERGAVTSVASFPVQGNPSYCEGPIGGNASAGTANGSGTHLCNVTVLSSDDLSVDQVERQNGQPVVPTTVARGAAQEYVNDMQRFGFGDTTNASTDARPVRCQPFPQQGSHCLLTVIDGQVVYSAGVRANLADDFRSGDFLKTRQYVTQTSNISEARDLRINLQAGALPTTLDLNRGTSQYLLPSYAQQFKTQSLLVGLIAVLVVAVVIFVRYREPRVAAPMIVTALSEVFILLGFAAFSGLALDLSYIAGFIAVVGTGVDDLVIIADEIMQNEVTTGRVFRNRFRKAFWVIAAAAATTIIAMSPLAVLSLGDLRGFAIVTIVGVLIGVLLTRPAYGNVLRTLLTD